MLIKTLIAASIGWPLLMAATVWSQAAGHDPWWVRIVYTAGSMLCHQIPTRSFHTSGVQWPVCARCAGLYLAAPVGAVLAAAGVRRSGTPFPAARSDRLLFALAALPTAVTLAFQWTGASPLTNTIRAITALPLGAAVMFVIIRAIPSPASMPRPHNEKAIE